MNADDVAELLGVPVSTILHWGRTGALPRVKLGRHVRFLRADVEKPSAARHSIRRRAKPPPERLGSAALLALPQGPALPSAA